MNKKIMRGVLFGIIVGTIGFFLGSQFTNRKLARIESEKADEIIEKLNTSDVLQPQVVTNSANYTLDEQQNINVYRNVNQTVVNISTEVLGMNMFWEAVPMQGGTGSGAIIDKSGYILTNTHVIADASKILISLADGSQYEGVVVGVDKENDIAVLKFDPPKDIELKTISFGNSSDLQVGQKVLAIGNPFGLERTLTVGIVSALGRPIMNDNKIIIKNMIQTDTAINPGNSGGPLLNSKGEMIGINTMIYSTSGSSAGVGFAVPVNTARRVVSEIIKYGKVRRGTIDASLVQVNNMIAKYAELNTDYGLLVSEVKKGSNAEKAGLRGGDRAIRVGYFRNSILYVGGDVILDIEGQPIKTLSDYYAVLEDKKPNEEVNITVLRGKKEMKLKILLSERNSK